MKKITLAFITIFTLITLSGNVSAGTYNFHGGTCQSFGKLDGSIKQKLGGIYNNHSTSYKGISCPILKDYNSRETGNTYIFWSGTGKITCTLYSLNPYGSVVQSQVGSRTNSGWFKIPPITSANSWGSYNLICNLPPKGTINTISVL